MVWHLLDSTSLCSVLSLTICLLITWILVQSFRTHPVPPTLATGMFTHVVLSTRTFPRLPFTCLISAHPSDLTTAIKPLGRLSLASLLGQILITLSNYSL